MKKFLKYFRDEEADKKVNLPLARRELEPPLYEYILDVFYSIEATGFIKLESYEHITDESEIDMVKYSIIRKKKGRTKKALDTININYDRCSLLKMDFSIHHKGETAYKTVELLIPKYDRNGFITLKSKQIFIMYQLVDKSTYTTKNSVVLKSLMPLCIQRAKSTITDTQGNTYDQPKYQVLNFKQKFNPFMLIAAKFGLTYAISVFGIAPIVKIVDADEPEDEDWKYFQVKTLMTTKKWRDAKIKVKVMKRFFDKYEYVRSMTAMVYEALCSSAKPTRDKIDTVGFWLDEIGYLYTKDRHTSRDIGRSTIVFFDRLIDRANKKMLKMYKWNKLSIENMIVTIVQNFDALKTKNNNDIENKRLRLYECISAILSIRIGRSVSRIISKGDKVTIDELIGILSLPPNLILRLLYHSQIITFNDIVNDMDFFNKFKYTIKGPNAITTKKNERKVIDRDRAVQIGSIGKIDPDVCSSSSPGLGGLISPFAEMYGLHFSDEMEPMETQFPLIKEIGETMKGKIHFKVPETYEEYTKYLEMKGKVATEEYEVSKPDRRMHVSIRRR